MKALAGWPPQIAAQEISLWNINSVPQSGFRATVWQVEKPSYNMNFPLVQILRVIAYRSQVGILSPPPFGSTEFYFSAFIWGAPEHEGETQMK